LEYHFPRAAQSPPYSSGGGYQDIGLSGFNLLQRTDIEVCQFGYFFLR
jgi:hypothetical protein